MSSFWPEGLEISDVQSPRDILNTANEEWQKNSNGILELVLQDAESESGNSMIIVHAKHVNNKRTATLFSIIHQPEKPYPVTIQLEEKEESLPEFLRKSYYKPIVLSAQERFDLEIKKKHSNIFDALKSREIPEKMKQVVNKWVSDTPSEFRKKLAEVFNLGIIKREILNLASSTTDNVNNANEDLAEEDV